MRPAADALSEDESPARVHHKDRRKENGANRHSPKTESEGGEREETEAAEKKKDQRTDPAAHINDYVPDVFVSSGDSIIMPEPAPDGQERPMPNRLEKPIPNILTPLGEPVSERQSEERKKEVSEKPVAVLTPPKALSNEEVTGHTANLWKYLPVPVSQPEPAPEYLHHFIRFPGSQITAARVRGKNTSMKALIATTGMKWRT